MKKVTLFVAVSLLSACNNARGNLKVTCLNSRGEVVYQDYRHSINLSEGRTWLGKDVGQKCIIESVDE